MSTVPKVLLIGEDYDSLMLLNFHLQQAGFQVLLAWSLSQATEHIQHEHPLLAIFDKTNLEGDSLELCRTLRQLDGRICIAVLSSQNSEDVRVKVFEAGADDYIVKPFNARELVLRVAAMLRRATVKSSLRIVPPNSSLSPTQDNRPTSTKLNYAGFTIDPHRRLVYKDGSAIELTRLEFDLLKFLYDHRGYVLSRNRLLVGVWKYHHSDDERVVDVVMARLRKKLQDDPNQPSHIQTIRGVGYKYVA